MPTHAHRITILSDYSPRAFLSFYERHDGYLIIGMRLGRTSGFNSNDVLIKSQKYSVHLSLEDKKLNQIHQSIILANGSPQIDTYQMISA